MAKLLIIKQTTFCNKLYFANNTDLIFFLLTGKHLFKTNHIFSSAGFLYAIQICTLKIIDFGNGCFNRLNSLGLLINSPVVDSKDDIDQFSAFCTLENYQRTA